MASEEIKALFDQMSARFDPAKAEGVNAAIQFDLTGDNGGQYWLHIADGKMNVGQGLVENPKMTLKASADDFMSMLGGRLNPMNAFMTGKIKVQGDTSLALKLMPLING